MGRLLDLGEEMVAHRYSFKEVNAVRIVDEVRSKGSLSESRIDFHKERYPRLKEFVGLVVVEAAMRVTIPVINACWVSRGSNR